MNLGTGEKHFFRLKFHLNIQRLSLDYRVNIKRRGTSELSKKPKTLTYKVCKNFKK